MSETWRDLLPLFEGRYVIVSLDSGTVEIRNLPVFLTRIHEDSHHLILEVRGGGRIRFESIYTARLDEDDRLVCISENGDSITVELAPAQPV